MRFVYSEYLSSALTEGFIASIIVLTLSYTANTIAYPGATLNTRSVIPL